LVLVEREPQVRALPGQTLYFQPLHLLAAVAVELQANLLLLVVLAAVVLDII
jgi:hypothetical protein